MRIEPHGLQLTLNTISHVADDEGDDEAVCLQLTLLVEGAEEVDHLYFLSPPEAAALAGWLEAGAAGALEDDPEDGPWLTVDASGALTLVGEGLTYAPLDGLAGGLRAGLAAAVAHPPRRVCDHRCGVAEGLDSSGAPGQLAVNVEHAVSDPGAPRLMIDWQGTWWLTDEEAGALADALESGSLERCAGEDPEPWLQVRRARGRVLLRLFDELVAEGDADGELWMTEAAAAALAAVLRDARAYQVEHPPYVFVPPEPGERLVVRRTL